MLLNIFTYTAFILFLTLLTACNKSEFKDIKYDAGYDYMPVDSGMWQIYDVREIIIDLPVSKQDTFIYQIKRVITETIDSSEQILKKRIENYYRHDTTESWQSYESHLLEKTSDYSILVEDNVPIVKHRYPLTVPKQWDGNLYNTSVEQIFTVKEINQPKTIGSKLFDSVLVIQQWYDSTLIELNNEIAQYAHGVGLIYFLEEHIESQNFDGTIDVNLNEVPIRERVVIGNFIEMKIVEYGK